MNHHLNKYPLPSEYSFLLSQETGYDNCKNEEIEEHEELTEYNQEMKDYSGCENEELIENYSGYENEVPIEDCSDGEKKELIEDDYSDCEKEVPKKSLKLSGKESARRTRMRANEFKEKALSEAEEWNSFFLEINNYLSKISDKNLHSSLKPFYPLKKTSKNKATTHAISKKRGYSKLLTQIKMVDFSEEREKLKGIIDFFLENNSASHS